MKKWMHKIELIVDRLIPYCLLVLLILVIFQLFYFNKLRSFEIYISIIDGIIVIIFALDLLFKYIRIRAFPKFFRKYWLDIIAITPAFLVLRLFEEFISIANIGSMTQDTFGEAVKIEKEGQLLIREIEKFGRGTSRIRYFSRFAKPLARIPRFLKAFSFFERPTGNHHLHDKKHSLKTNLQREKIKADHPQ